MQIPLQITFRHMEPSPALEARIRQEAGKLDKFYEKVMSCRVVVEAPHRHHHKGNLYQIRIDLKTPGKEIVVTRAQHDNHAHEDVYVVVRDAFNSVQRQVEDFARHQRREVKHHETPAHGRVLTLVPDDDYGKIETTDGREIYFHRNSVLNGGYHALAIGSEVRFTEEAGEEGPQASYVSPIGKHHIVG
jgi:ribosome-associated translation inhibitor RaiA